MLFPDYFRYHKFLDSDNYIKSIGSKVIVCKQGLVSTYNVGSILSVPFSRFSLIRRLLRLNRLNVRELPNGNILIINNFKVFIVKGNNIEFKFKFDFTRYVHEETISIIENRIIIGEYGNSKRKFPVGIYRSEDYGQTWRREVLKKPGLVKNILSVYFDEYSNKYWVFFGESETESRIEIYDLNWGLFKVVGYGDYRFRSISSFFFLDKVIWFMNNPCGDSFLVNYNRDSEEIILGCKFPGPIWYSIKSGSKYIVSTASEENTSSQVYIFISEDCENWRAIGVFQKDFWNKKYFLYGLVSFPKQSALEKTVLIYCEAIKKFDNKMIYINL